MPVEPRESKPYRDRRDRRVLSRSLVLATLLVSAACATAPPTPPAPAAPTYEQKLAAILRFEDTRVLRDPPAREAALAADSATSRRPAVPAPRRVDDVVSLLEDEEGRVRRRAALAVGRIGLAEGVEPLVRTLEDVDPEVRAMAAFGLGLIGERGAEPALRKALSDPDPRVQGRAAEALGAIGATAAAEAIGQLVSAGVSSGVLNGIAEDDLLYPMPDDVEALRLGLYALVRLKAWDAFAAAVLDPSGAPRVRWWPVAYAIQRFADPRGFVALASLAGGQGTETVGFAARGLGLLKDPRGVDVLVRLVDPSRYEARVIATAVRSLGQIADPRAAAPLLKLLRLPGVDQNVRLEIVTALGAMRAADAADTLTDLIGDRWDVLRGAALAALAGIDPAGFVIVLSTLDADPSWIVRAHLATTLGVLEAQGGVPKLTAMLEDDDDRVVVRVLEALAAQKAPQLESVLAERLGAKDVAVRATAATLLGELKTAGAAAALDDAYRAAKADTSYTARAASLAALAKLGAGPARESLRDALADPDWAVRRRAAELLRELDPAADVSSIRPAPSTRTAAEYQAPSLVAPAYSPHAYIEVAGGVVEVELAVLDAPLTVQNFVDLARRGFFDGVSIHRVVPNFVVQDGDPRGDGEGGPGYTIRDEINTRPYLRGTVGMALDWADTGGSQFFITHGPQPHLDGRYTVFGQVVSGMELVDRIARGEVIGRVWVWDGGSASR